MFRAVQKVARRVAVRAPYPLALQSLLTLVLLATVFSTLESGIAAPMWRFVLFCCLAAVHLAACWLVPVRQLRTWQQLLFLSLQVGAASLADTLVPQPLFGYVHLAVVMQAIYLFRPLLWSIFAACVYVAWSGSLMIASASFFEWFQSNLLLGFPVLCILFAAVAYARQHRGQEQAQSVLQDMQRRYEALALRLHDATERAVFEERQRLAATVAEDISAAIAQTEQNIANAISQAQHNLVRLDAAVAQTRESATAAIERMRMAVAGLRLGTHAEAPTLAPAAVSLPPEELMPLAAQRALRWSLPSAFVGIALTLAVLHWSPTPLLVVLFALCCAALIGGYLFTQRIRHPWLVLLGLSSQAAAVIGLVFVTHALPLTLGLLLVMWQTAMRLSGVQIVAFLVGVQSLIGLALVRVLPLPGLDGSLLLVFCVAAFAVIGLVGTARQQLARRSEVAARLAQLAHLTSEREQQVVQAQMLAVAVERTRVARELHDDLGYRLMLLNMQLQLADDLIADDPAAALEQLCSTREQLRQTWSSVLGVADAALAVDGASLASVLERLVEHNRALTDMQIEFRSIGDCSELTPDIACGLYRAVQEGLTNVVKHAQATRVQVLVYCDDVEARVRVRDNGRGTASRDDGHSVGHFGLIGLRERAELLGGTFITHALPDGGFELNLCVPLP